jgi:hypothetical protein
MNVLIAFVAGCILGWISYRYTVNWGARVLGQDDMKVIMDKLSFSQLVKLKDSVVAEIEKRKGVT